MRTEPQNQRNVLCGKVSPMPLPGGTSGPPSSSVSSLWAGRCSMWPAGAHPLLLSLPISICAKLHEMDVTGTLGWGKTDQGQLHRAGREGGICLGARGPLWWIPGTGLRSTALLAEAKELSFRAPPLHFQNTMPNFILIISCFFLKEGFPKLQRHQGPQSQIQPLPR